MKYPPRITRTAEGCFYDAMFCYKSVHTQFLSVWCRQLHKKGNIPETMQNTRVCPVIPLTNCSELADESPNTKQEINRSAKTENLGIGKVCDLKVFLMGAVDC